MQVEFDGSRVDCCELVQTKDASEVEDHKIELIGPDIDEFEVGFKHSIDTLQVCPKEYSGFRACI